MACAGKTTFIKNLLAPYAQDPDVKVNNVAGHEALKTFIETPEKLSTTVLVNDHNSLTSFHYRVQETPGELFLSMLLNCASSVSTCTVACSHSDIFQAMQVSGIVLLVKL